MLYRQPYHSIRRNLRWLIPLWIWAIKTSPILSATPDVILSVSGIDETWKAKRANFGSDAEQIGGRLISSPPFDEYLCDYFLNEDSNLRVPSGPPSEPLIMLAPRGLCSFEKKAYSAKTFYKASAVLIYDNPSARYRYNYTSQEVIYPRDETDYECSNGFGLVDNIELDPPEYNSTVLDPILDMTTKVSNCTLEATRQPCDSKICMITGPAAKNTSSFPVCCAWDVPVTMVGGGEVDTDGIVAVFLTIRQGEAISEHEDKQVTIEERYNPPFNASMIFLWMLAVLITWGSCRFAATDYRVFRSKLARFQATRDAIANEAGAKGTDDPEQGVPDESDILAGEMDDESSDAGEPVFNEPHNLVLNETFNDEVVNVREGENKAREKQQKSQILRSLPPPPRTREGKGQTNDTKKDQEVWVLYSLPPSKGKKIRRKKGYKEEQTAETNILPSDSGDPLPDPWATPIGGSEMTHWHVMGFVASASIMLFLLFFFRFYNIIFIFYGFGCAGAVSYLIFGPILARVVPMIGGSEAVKELNKKVVCGLNGFDVTSQLTGYLWAILWIWYGLSHYRPSTNAFFWISIDAFGACFCFLVISMLTLSNIKIATMLLVAVFFYDIFFVFITPFFFDGESIMITVAKGGSSEGGTDDFCFKYPEDGKCTGIDFLPMLLVIPRLNDYTNGASLLGLGDIVLPGYLIAFCARLDEAKRIVGKHTKTEIEYTEKWYQGYFFWMMIAYAIGLALAFLAFAISGVGQPALLYLVPCCLIMLCILGRNEIINLWTGARAIKLAEKLKTKCERAWGKEKMRREVARLKHERAVEGSNGDRAPYSNDSDDEQRRLSGKGGFQKRKKTLTSKGKQPLFEQKKVVDSTNDTKPRADATPRKDSNNRKNLSKKLLQETKSSPDKYPVTLVESSPQRTKGSLSEKQLREAPLPDREASIMKERDILFRDPKQMGTKYLRTVIRHEIKATPDLEFSLSVYDSIRSKLKQRAFFVRDKEEKTRKASTGEIKQEIKRMFNMERKKMKSEKEKRLLEANNK